MNANPHKNIIIAVVGDYSYHRRWMRGANKEFDLMIVYYGETKDKYKEDAKFYLQTSGMFKLENIAYAVQTYYDVIKTYKAVWLPDDDMLLNTASINRLFRVFEYYKLDLACPSIYAGIIGHPMMKTCFGNILRYTSYVDMGCPVFRTELLLELLPLFTLNRSGLGIDYFWSARCSEKKLAIIDSVCLAHWKNSGSSKDQNSNWSLKLSKTGIDPQNEMQQLFAQNKFNCPEEIYDSIKFPQPYYSLEILKGMIYDFIRLPLLKKMRSGLRKLRMKL